MKFYVGETEGKKNNSRISGNKTFAVFINVYLAESTEKNRGKFLSFFPRQTKEKKANTKKVSIRGRTMRCPFCLSGKANAFWLTSRLPFGCFLTTAFLVLFHVLFLRFALSIPCAFNNNFAT